MEEAELVVNGEIEMVTRTAAPAHISDALDEVLSGWRFRSDLTQEMQMDDFDNPGMIWVETAAELWGTPEAPRANPAWIATERQMRWPVSKPFTRSGTKVPVRFTRCKCR